MLLLRPTLLLAIAALAAPATRHAAALAAAQQRGPVAGAFVIRLGTDTVTVERFTRTPTRLEGTAVNRQPRTTLRAYTIELGADGRAVRAEVVLRRPGEAPDAPPIQRAVATFSGDSAFVEIRRDTAVQTRRIAVGPGAIPLAGLASTSFAGFELATMALRRARTDSLVLRGYSVGAGGAAALVVRALGRDSVSIYDGNNTFHARVDGEGRIVGAVPLSGTQQFSVERVAGADVAALATAFAARDQQGQALGQLSPRDTVRASVVGASLLVDYGRPAKRGRVLFGGTIAPWGQVWRTGANAATQFSTDRALEMGGVVVPAGRYTLWTIPNPTGWKLVINAQTGQWGTAHDPQRDLFQLDMAVRTLPQVVERFLILVEPQGQGGVLKLQWDTTEASIPFTVR
jgi:hypothetical protein